MTPGNEDRLAPKTTKRNSGQRALNFVVKKFWGMQRERDREKECKSASERERYLYVYISRDRERMRKREGGFGQHSVFLL